MGKPLHRIGTARRRQGVSALAAAQRLAADVETVRQQEDETADLLVSQLLAWQRALQVDVADLLVDPDHPLPRPPLERRRWAELMKTATAIGEGASDAELQQLAALLLRQLREIGDQLQ